MNVIFLIYWLRPFDPCALCSFLEFFLHLLRLAGRGSRLFQPCAAVCNQCQGLSWWRPRVCLVSYPLACVYLTALVWQLTAEVCATSFNEVLRFERTFYHLNLCSILGQGICVDFISCTSFTLVSLVRFLVVPFVNVYFVKRAWNLCYLSSILGCIHFQISFKTLFPSKLPCIIS